MHDEPRHKSDQKKIKIGVFQLIRGVVEIRNAVNPNAYPNLERGRREGRVCGILLLVQNSHGSKFEKF